MQHVFSMSYECLTNDLANDDSIKEKFGPFRKANSKLKENNQSLQITNSIKSRLATPIYQARYEGLIKVKQTWSKLGMYLICTQLFCKRRMREESPISHPIYVLQLSWRI